MPITVGGAVLAATAALAVAGGTGGPDRADGADLAPARAALASTPLGPDLPWPPSSDDNYITVRGSKCPKSHPHKVGSSSAARWTRINGGPVKHRSSHAVICAR